MFSLATIDHGEGQPRVSVASNDAGRPGFFVRIGQRVLSCQLEITAQQYSFNHRRRRWWAGLGSPKTPG